MYPFQKTKWWNCSRVSPHCAPLCPWCAWWPLVTSRGPAGHDPAPGHRHSNDCCMWHAQRCSLFMMAVLRLLYFFEKLIIFIVFVLLKFEIFFVFLSYRFLLVKHAVYASLHQALRYIYVVSTTVKDIYTGLVFSFFFHFAYMFISRPCSAPRARMTLWSTWSLRGWSKVTCVWTDSASVRGQRSRDLSRGMFLWLVLILSACSSMICRLDR